MPAKPSQRRSDLRLVLGSAIAVIVGGIIVAAAILAVSSRGKLPDVKGPLSFGLAANREKEVREGGPIFIAGLSSDEGFWIAIEHRELVALLVNQPPPAACTLRWRGSKNTFTCDDKPVESANLARYKTSTRAKGPQKGLYMVELRNVAPAPAGPPQLGD